ncbi:MAG: sulfite exporter TauE/SafE family protein [Planctomycetales bacterium]|nr:sulfite exporter TauE/SafE family protein [Planctomycetales bacterium]MCA9169582.1 sulfite exporter TauE/SafE family protein [Planctomycetales bacterium]
MTAIEVAQIAISLAIGACVQSTLGFGMGMVATPLLVWNGGFTLPQAIGMLVPNILAQTLFGCWRYRRELPWDAVWEVCAYRYLGLPAGVIALVFVAEQGADASRAVLGAGLLIALIVQQVRPANSSQVPPGHVATFTASFSSGFLAGVVGMGGPPLVLWVMQQNWSSSRQRSFLWLSFLLVMPIQIAMMSYNFGREWLVALGAGMLIVPVTLAIAAIVGRWADRLSKERLRFGMRLFLLIIAVRLIVQWVRN